MSEPIVFIARQRIKEGKLEGYKQNFQEVVNFVEPNKPNTIAFLDYVSEDGTEATLIQMYANMESMEQHMQGLSEIAKRSYEFMDVMTFEIYGNPNDTILTMMRNLAKSGAAVKITPHRIGGYIRLKGA